MGNFLRIGWLIFADFLAFILMAVTIFLILNRTEIPRFIKGAIGAVFGIIFEGLRQLLAIGFLKLFVHDLSFSGFAGVLAGLSFAKIPWFVFLGYLIGSAAVKTKGYVCPNCKKSFEQVFEEPVGGSQATGLEIVTFEEPCPHCGALLVHNASTYEIISHKPKKAPEPVLIIPEDEDAKSPR